jgi:hypothetical protein
MKGSGVGARIWNGDEDVASPFRGRTGDLGVKADRMTGW